MKYKYFWSVIFFIPVVLGCLFIGDKKGVVASTTRPVKEITMVNVEGEGDLYQSAQSDITIEHVHGHFLLRDSDSKRQYTFVNRKKIGNKNKVSYTDTENSKVKLIYDKREKKITYNNSTFKKVDNSGKILNVQIAIDKVRRKLKQKNNRVISGSNVRLTSKSGRLYYKIKVRSRNHQESRIYRVYSDDGQTLWTNKK